MIDLFSVLLSFSGVSLKLNLLASKLLHFLTRVISRVQCTI